MVLNPCCGISLQNGVRIVAGVEFFTSAGFFLSGLITLQKFANASTVGDEYTSGTWDLPSLFFGIAYLIFAIFQFVLALYLFVGANREKTPHCYKWFLGAWIILVLLITFAACETYQGRLTANILWAKPVFLGFTSLVKLYCIWVVYEFMTYTRYSVHSSERDSTTKTPI